MNKLFAVIFVLIAAATLSGCDTKSEKGGRAGNETFRITVPTMKTSIKQGELQTARVGVERGGGFKQSVRLVVKPPPGIQVEPTEIVVQPSDKGDIQLKVSVANDASLGEQKILVKGTPDKGEATETEFKINVVAK